MSETQSGVLLGLLYTKNSPKQDVVTLAVAFRESLSTSITDSLQYTAQAD